MERILPQPSSLLVRDAESPAPTTVGLTREIAGAEQGKETGNGIENYISACRDRRQATTVKLDQIYIAFMCQ